MTFTFTRVFFLLIENMNIRRFLNKNNKKRDESSGSKEDDVPIRQWEESSNVSYLDSPTLPGNMTAESLKSNGCSEMLMNCLKKLEKVKDLTLWNNANQIKGERHFLDLKDVVGFISNNFEDFECGRLKKKNILKEIKAELNCLKRKMDNITPDTHRQEQYYQINCLLIHDMSW